MTKTHLAIAFSIGAAAIVAGPLTMTGQKGSPSISVGAESRVSSSKDGWSGPEYMADADPMHPERLIACVQVLNPSTNWHRSEHYASFDRGKTWRLTKSRASTMVAGDPACTYTMNGQSLFAVLVGDTGTRTGPRLPDEWETWEQRTNERMRMMIYRSRDGGRSFFDSTRLGFIDNENILIDRSGGKYHGRIYIHGNTTDWTYSGSSANKLWLIRSEDSGYTFTKSDATWVGEAWQEFDAGTVTADGAVIVPYILNVGTGGSRSSVEVIAVASSTNGGEYLSQPDTVYPSNKTCSFPIMASDLSQGPFRGRAYILWGQQRASGTFNRGGEHCVIVVAHSDDNGKTWSEPVAVSDAPPPIDTAQWRVVEQPAIAVNKDGVVGVSWYDKREDARGRTRRLRFSASTDGGGVWTPSVAVAKHPLRIEGPLGLPSAIPRTSLDGVRGSARKDIETTFRASNAVIGHYSVLAADAKGTFHTFWIDNRGTLGTQTHLYTAPVTVRGKVTRRGSADLAALDDVTPNVELRYRDVKTSWNGNAATLTISFVVANRGKDTIKGPLEMRITSVASDIGTPTLQISGAEDAGIGTVVDLTNVLPRAGLLPGRETERRTLSIVVTGIDRSRVAAGMDGIARFSTRIYGRTK
jgi:hypothetical protein